MNNSNTNVLISAISSDIGAQLGFLYRQHGSQVIGTYRNPKNIALLRDKEGIDLVRCDVSRPESVHAAAKKIGALGKPWELFISAVGQLTPIGPFFDCEIGEWSASVDLNSVGQLRLLHAIYPYRRPDVISKVAFLVGGGVNNPFTNYSAYCLGKIMLIKMCELLDDEYPNVHAIAVGTGWVNTKIHRQTLAARDKGGANFRRTLEFVTSGNPGTSYTDIFDCINWCFSHDRELTSGRNFSVVHDGWKARGDHLLRGLLEDADRFKLRRRSE